MENTWFRMLSTIFPAIILQNFPLEKLDELM